MEDSVAMAAIGMVYLLLSSSVLLLFVDPVGHLQQRLGCSADHACQYLGVLHAGDGELGALTAEVHGRDILVGVVEVDVHVHLGWVDLS